MRKLLTAFSSERGLKGYRVRLCTGRDGEPEGTHQRSGMQAVAHAWRLGPWQEGRRMATVRRALPERQQRDAALLVRGAAVRHT
jgi:hypothetical protein